MKNRYITVLDFEVSRVFQYKLEKLPAKLDGDEYLANKGHNPMKCEWMVHENPVMWQK
tara:strand:+ start:56 stop:229 length:174 start_codon:yes stop_codon:yes gene_type:complete